MMMKKWKCASMLPLVSSDERRGAEDQAAGDEERGPAAVGDEVAENQADQGGDHSLGRLHGGMAECQPEAHQ